MTTSRQHSFIVSGGGTGGHIYPAIAIARELQKRFPNARIEFVGAKGKMEMQLVPEAGFPIQGLWISGIQRKLTVSNLLFPLKLIASLWKAGRILSKVKPDAVVGVGGFASGPLLYMASRKEIPTLIQEQNSYPGITNKLLAKKVDVICTAFPGLERFFPASKMVLTGNPVRSDIMDNRITAAEARVRLELDPGKTTVLVIGGSLGARTINDAMESGVDRLNDENIQVIWQTGKFYAGEKQVRLGRRMPFIKEMDLAYAAADVVVSRAGALSISELCLVGKPVILVPSPNVAEDHQTKNAMTLVDKKAAILMKDHDAAGKLIQVLINLCNDKVQQAELGANIRTLAKPDASKDIVNQLIKLIE